MTQEINIFLGKPEVPHVSLEPSQKGQILDRGGAICNRDVGMNILTLVEIICPRTIGERKNSGTDILVPLVTGTHPRQVMGADKFP